MSGGQLRILVQILTFLPIFPPPKKDKKAPASGSSGGGGFAELWLMKKVFGMAAYQAGCALLAFFLPVMKQ